MTGADGRGCRLGLAGAGNVARRHAAVLSGFADVELVGVADVVSSSARRLAAEYGIRAFPDLTSLVETGLDALYICVPPFAHGQAERTAVEAGLPIFVEKPVAADLGTASRIAGLVARRAVPTSVGYHWRYLDGVERARDLLAGRPVRAVRAAWLDRTPSAPWWCRRDASGGPVVEQGSHLLDVLRLLVGEVAEVIAYGDGTPPPVPEADIDGVTAAMLRFTGGAVGTLMSASVLDWRHCAGVEIVADGLVLTLAEDELVVRDGDGVRRYGADPRAARTAVDRAFVDLVRGIGDDVRSPYPDALRTHQLACAVAESALTGRPVRPRADLPSAGARTGPAGAAAPPLAVRP
ncbi:Gfo/Idh/MocA family oxidoreductase [Micromonospora sp. NPDC049559]|uniref:Gfo/Idh/MocA family protein n=1 Tax=Micromonospora sp. NPDC049559 TaxID=3155923 RepID=UPI003425581F